MTLNIKDLGIWEVYTPEKMPEWTNDIPAGYKALFARRKSDGVDWYDFRKAANSFTPGYLLAMTSEDPFSKFRVVQGVYRDRTAAAVPTNLQVIEIEDINPNDATPWKQYEQRAFDPSTLTIGDLWTRPVISVQDYQFAGQANAEGILTDEETDDWVGSGVVPQSLVDAVKKLITDKDRQRRVLLFLRGTKSFPRFHELTPLLAASFGKDTPEKVDAFFNAASKR
ncbi:hypothetical protein [Methylobacterium sp.]|uniref:hypothetical protein n=1 Tax=Methylobacterium sp. TaxID=409 RepID=UPI000F907861|nr:hypothetical protein [Methylobacterium sp.]RUP22648.1 MAG: hypothetical protein EKK44_04055 [Methylobacterium sp.]